MLCIQPHLENTVVTTCYKNAPSENVLSTQGGATHDSANAEPRNIRGAGHPRRTRTSIVSALAQLKGDNERSFLGNKRQSQMRPYSAFHFPGGHNGRPYSPTQAVNVEFEFYDVFTGIRS